MIAVYLALAAGLHQASGQIPAPIAQPDDGVLTLQEALAIAEQRAFALRLAAVDVRTADAEATLAQAQLLPGVSVNATTQYSDARTPGGFGQNGSSTSTTIRLAVQQIIDISRVYSLRADAAELNADAARAGERATLNTLRGDVKVAFFAALQAKDLVTVRQLAVDSTQARLDQARIRFEEGAIPQFDVLRVESELRLAQQNLIQAQGDYLLAKQRLNSLLARPIETEFEPVASPDFVDTLQDPSVYVAASLQDRAELDQAELAIDALRKLTDAARREALPSMTLNAGYGRTIDPGFGQPEQSTTASATISIPIVTGGAIRANTERARQAEERARIILEQLQLSVAFEVRTAITQWQTALASYRTAVQNREVAEEAFRIAQLRYNEGAGILLEVSTTQAELTAARAQEVIAAFQLRSAYANLQRAVGTEDLVNLPTNTAPTPGSSDPADQTNRTQEN